MGMSAPASRRLWVTRRSAKGSIKTVGRLTEQRTRDETTFEFVYTVGAELYPDLVPLPGFPDLHRRYENTELFPLFTSRQMPRRRPDYPSFVEQLNLPIEADPFEVLGRSEGKRMTDRIEVFPDPKRDSEGRLTTVFFARGVRHLPEATDAITTLHIGEELLLANEPQNRFNPRARLINTQTGHGVGYVPDYLLHLMDHLQGDFRPIAIQPVTTTS